MPTDRRAPPFDLPSATTPLRRMRAVRRFVRHWYGPAETSYRIESPDPRLPRPLREFYSHDGRRPYQLLPGGPGPQADGEFFYEGAGGHHLFPPERVEFLKDGRVRFGMEYQGDWEFVTDAADPGAGPTEDPPVWLVGSPPDPGALLRDGYSFGPRGERRLGCTLSEALAAHILFTTLYETENGPFHGSPEHCPAAAELFRRPRATKVLLWEAGFYPASAPEYDGRVWLLDGTVLAHELSPERAAARGLEEPLAMLAARDARHAERFGDWSNGWSRTVAERRPAGER